jgi:hypothetical protein
LIRLPNLGIWYEPLAVKPAALNRMALGLRDSACLFWCGHTMAKYLPQYDEIFPRIAATAGVDCQFVFVACDIAPAVVEVFRNRLGGGFHRPRPWGTSE